MKKYYLIIILLLINLSVIPQKIDIQIIYNNLGDEIKFSKLNTNIKSGINTENIQKSLQNNYTITDKNLTIQIIFYDRSHIGLFKLKNENPLSPEEYIKTWKENHSSNNVAFLFVKGFKAEDYSLNKLIVSNALEEAHLFPIIVDYINANLKGGTLKIIQDGTKFLMKTFNPIWTETKKTQAVRLIETKQKYWASYGDFIP